MQVKYFSCSEIAKMTGMSLRAVWARCKSGEIKASRPGGRDYVIAEDDLNSFMEKFLAEKASADDCLRCYEIADRLGVKKRTIYGWIRAGKLKAVRPRGRDYLVSKDDLAAFMASDNRVRGRKAE